MNIFKKFILLCLCLSMICTLFGFQTVEGATAYDETISNGSFSDFQQALLNAKDKGNANHIYKIHITKDLRINQSVGIYSNTMIVVDKNVKIIRNLPAGDGGTTFRVGKPGSSASGYYYRNITIIANAKGFGLYSYNCSGKVTGGKIAIVVSTVSVHTRKVSHIARLSSLITVQTVNVIITEVNLLLSKECL